VTLFAAESHPGNRYQHNEDSLGWSEEAGVWFVADGMGGHACGDVASRVVKQSVLQYFSAAAEAPERNVDLTQMIMQAHASVVAEGQRLTAQNMGSTLVLVRLAAGLAHIGWCGDSRAYLWRQNELVRLTRDHSLLEQLLDSGVVDPADAFGHPQKHVLVQALGISEPVPVPSEIKLELASGDLLLLCSDGLHDELRDEEMVDLLRINPKPGEVVQALMRRVLEGPARDNISIVVLDVGEITECRDALSIAQLRERFERPALVPPSSANLSAGMPEGSAPEKPVLKAAKIALPVSKGSKSAISELDRDLLVSIAVVVALITLLLLF